MKKLATLIAAAALFVPAALAQEPEQTTAAQEQTTYEPLRALPKEGDIRLGVTMGWNFTMRFDNDNHTKPIMPLGINADYTFKTFADGKGSVAGGVLFDFLRYATWFTRDTMTAYGTVKTTQTWSMGMLAATVTGRYCWGQDFEAFARFALGRGLILGYKEEYSDEGYASVVPHTNGPSGGYLAWGLQLGVGRYITDNISLQLFLGLNSFATLGFNIGYKF
ncbi:MAG: hypothetical protein J6X77_02015 [Bacteroidales bacterium]|nr:hypothetical protein [Bacteroidales bacterium]